MRHLNRIFRTIFADLRFVLFVSVFFWILSMFSARFWSRKLQLHFWFHLGSFLGSFLVFFLAARFEITLLVLLILIRLPCESALCQFLLFPLLEDTSVLTIRTSLRIEMIVSFGVQREYLAGRNRKDAHKVAHKVAPRFGHHFDGI